MTLPVWFLISAFSISAFSFSGCASRSTGVPLDGGHWTPVRVQPEPEPVFGPLPEYNPKPRTSQRAVPATETVFSVEFHRDRAQEFFRVRAEDAYGQVSDWATTGDCPLPTATPGHIRLGWKCATSDLAQICDFQVWSSADLRTWSLKTNVEAQ